jgi:cytochrome P460
MPSARMPNTVCAASDSPTPVQIAPIQSQRRDRRPRAVASMRAMLPHGRCLAGNAGNRHAPAVSGLARQALCSDTDTMNTKTIALTAGLLCLCSIAQSDSPGPHAHDPSYTADGRLIFPENYREWVFLTAGIDMSYMDGMEMDHHMLDNVFVDPASYKIFVATGTWPDKTMLVKENRRADSHGSINKSGNFQTTEIMGIEIHVKDEAHFPGKWAFFGFGGKNQPAAMIPTAASCYSCHAAHAAVDNTFVQFYPTLLPIAKDKGTLSARYIHDEAAAK